MEKFNFLLGEWNLQYIIPKSSFSDEDKGQGEGIFQRKLNDSYVFFDYEAKFSKMSAQAHGVFVKDSKSGIYRYWWFEDSGNYMTATCDFIDKDTLFLNWHNSLLIQTFERIHINHIVLKMSYPDNKQHYTPIMVVDFYRK